MAPWIYVVVDPRRQGQGGRCCRAGARVSFREQGPWDHGGIGAVVVDHAEVVGKKRDPKEHGSQQHHHPDHGLGGVLGRQVLEGGDAVGDGLHPREGGAARGIGPHEHPDEGQPGRFGAWSRPPGLLGGGLRYRRGPDHPGTNPRGAASG